MKELMHRAWDSLEAKHITVLLFSMLASFLASRQDAGLGMSLWHRVSNVVSGFAGASLIGMALLEAGMLQWLATGFAYLGGHLVNRFVNAAITVSKEAETNPFAFFGRILSGIGQVVTLAFRIAKLLAKLVAVYWSLKFPSKS